MARPSARPRAPHRDQHRSGGSDGAYGVRLLPARPELTGPAWVRSRRRHPLSAQRSSSCSRLTSRWLSRIKFVPRHARLADPLQREDINDLRAVVEEFFTKTGIVKYGLFDTENHQSKLFGSSSPGVRCPLTPVQRSRARRCLASSTSISSRESRRLISILRSSESLSLPPLRPSPRSPCMLGSSCSRRRRRGSRTLTTAFSSSFAAASRSTLLSSRCRAAREARRAQGCASRAWSSAVEGTGSSSRRASSSTTAWRSLSTCRQQRPPSRPLLLPRHPLHRRRPAKRVPHAKPPRVVGALTRRSPTRTTLSAYRRRRRTQGYSRRKASALSARLDSSASTSSVSSCRILQSGALGSPKWA